MITLIVYNFKTWNNWKGDWVISKRKATLKTISDIKATVMN